MKKMLLTSSVLLLILINATSVCFAQTTKSKHNKSAPKAITTKPSPQMNPSLKSGLDYLKARDYKYAKKAFKKAKKGADKAQKKQCNNLLKVAKRYNKIYFLALQKAISWRETRNYKRVILEYNSAKTNFQSIDRTGLSAILKPVDDKLMKQHAEEVQALDQTRKKAWREAVKEAEKLSKTAPRIALTKVDYARSQMNDPEIEDSGIERIAENTKYNIFIFQGDSLASKGLGEQAHNYYEQAKKLKDSPEIREKIKTLNDKLYVLHLNDANNKAHDGKYRSAAYAYENALKYTDDQETVKAKQKYWLDYLFQKGKTEFSLGKYTAADRYYGDADMFGYSDELRKAREEVRPYIEFEKYMDLVEKQLAEGNAKEAQNALLSALKHRSNDRAQELKIRLEIYFEQMDKALGYLNKNNKSEAMKCVNTALLKIPNGKDALSFKKSLETPTPATKT